MNVETALEQMKAYITGFPENIRMALGIGESSFPDFNTRPISNVLIAGLGGSGIGGKIVSQLVWDDCKVPIQLINDYSVPAWVNADTLFIAVSYSGNTEETLSALGQAQKNGAEVACITSGGALASMAAEKGYNVVTIPGGQPPRTSFGINSTQLFFILHAYDLIDHSFADSLKIASEIMDTKKEAIHAEAKKIADKINGFIPVIYSEARLEGVAMRFRQQINENAKSLCWHHALPEMNHNELVGWAGGSNQMAAVFITTPDDHPNTLKRMELTREIISKKTPNIVDVSPLGNNRIERAYYLIHLFDWVSYYLAEMNQVDPMEIDVIDYLKTELSKG